MNKPPKLHAGVREVLDRQDTYPADVIDAVNKVSADAPRGEITKILNSSWSTYSPLHEYYGFDKKITDDVLAVISLRRTL